MFLYLLQTLHQIFANTTRRNSSWMYALDLWHLSKTPSPTCIHKTCDSELYRLFFRMIEVFHFDSPARPAPSSDPAVQGSLGAGLLIGSCWWVGEGIWSLWKAHKEPKVSQRAPTPRKIIKGGLYHTQFYMQNYTDLFKAAGNKLSKNQRYSYRYINQLHEQRRK